MKHVKQLYKTPMLRNLTSSTLLLLAFLTCASTPLLGGGYDDDTKEDFDRDIILDKVQDVIWDCAKGGFTDLAVSLTSAVVNYPYIQPDDYIKFLELRSKMYLLNGDPEDAFADRNLAKRKRLSPKN